MFSIGHPCISYPEQTNEALMSQSASAWGAISFLLPRAANSPDAIYLPVILGVSLMSMAAYALTIKTLPGRKFISFFIFHSYLKSEGTSIGFRYIYKALTIIILTIGVYRSPDKIT